MYYIMFVIDSQIQLFLCFYQHIRCASKILPTLDHRSMYIALHHASHRSSTRLHMSYRYCVQSLNWRIL